MQITELEALADVELLPAREALGHGGLSVTLAAVSACNSATAVNVLTACSSACASACQTVVVG